MTLRTKVSGRIAKPVHDVFEAVADPAKLSKYFATGAGTKGRLEAGATVMWEFHDFPGAFPVTVREVVQDKKIVLMWPSNDDAAEGATFATLMLSRLGDQFADWQERRHDEPREWQDAAIFSSASVWMTVDELVTFGELVHGKIEQYRAGTDRPDNARRVRISLFALPTADHDHREKKEDSAS